MKERPAIGSLSHEEKDALIHALLARVEELERRLGLDSSNSGRPPSTDGYRKKPRPKNLREKTKQKSGGQEGHEGKNLRQRENPDRIIDHCASVCAGCGGALGLEDSIGHSKRQVFDLPEPQPVQVTEHRAHTCQCPRCSERTKSPFPQDVSAPAQYGANIAALVVYLLHWHFLSEDRVVEVLHDVFGVEITTGTVASMAQRKAQDWQSLASGIKDAIKQAPVKHMDETGYRIAGALQWLHVASTRLLTFYRTSQKRGSLEDGVGGIVVHDFWRPYFTMDAVQHALCNAHHLRELKALMEIEKEPWAKAMFRFLRHACHAANRARQRSEPLKPAFIAWMQARYDRIVAQGLAFHEAMPPLVPAGERRRGKTRRRTGHNLLLRLQGHKDEALRFLTNPDVPFSNNQAERDIRMMKLKQKISGCFRAEAGAATFATLRTVLSTARKQGWNILQTLTSPPTHLTQILKTA